MGQLGHTVYDAASLAKFDEMVRRGELEVVGENEKTGICGVKGQRTDDGRH